MQTKLGFCNIMSHTQWKKYPFQKHDYDKKKFLHCSGHVTADIQHAFYYTMSLIFPRRVNGVISAENCSNTHKASVYSHLQSTMISNTMRLGQNSQDFFKSIFDVGNCWTLVMIWQKIVAKGPVGNTSVMVQIMARCRMGIEPLSQWWLSLSAHNCMRYSAPWVNTLRPRQNGRHFADDALKCIFLNENVWIPIKFSLKFVPKVPINNIPALVRIMAWHRRGD